MSSTPASGQPRARASAASPDDGETRSEMGRSMVALDQGWAMGQEMLAGILIVSGLGYLADRALGTTPWLFAIGALAGFACGLTLVYGRAQRMDEVEAAERAARDASAAAKRAELRSAATPAGHVPELTPTDGPAPEVTPSAATPPTTTGRSDDVR